ncbi:MAG: hypothetical protein ACM3WP_02100 [Acidobacteriota bacterium]
MTMTFEELREKSPECADDLWRAYSGIGAAGGCIGHKFNVTVESMAKWMRRAKETQTVFDDDNEHECRITEIMNELRDGGDQFPVFCIDGCLMEGHHRLVAFNRLGLETLTVVDVDWDATSMDEEPDEETGEVVMNESNTVDGTPR